MPDIVRVLLRFLGLGTLYALAFPFFVPALLRKLRSQLNLRRALADGWIVCPYCRQRTPLVGQATCRNCGYTEMGSLLYCSNCKQVVARWVDCRACHNSIKVW